MSSFSLTPAPVIPHNNTTTPRQTNCHKSKPSRLLFYKRMGRISKRLLSNDLRKAFPIMYCNVINQLDYAILDSLLCRYMTPNCEMICGAMPQLGVPVHCYQGPSQCAKNIHEKSSSLPDHIIFLESSRIIRPLYEEHSIIEMLIVVNATKVVYPSSLPNPTPTPTVVEMNGSLPLPQTVNIMFKLRELYYMNNTGSIVKVVVTVM
eukprot:scaffold2953_cov187-Ochromonas_danica.AAC.7